MRKLFALLSFVFCVPFAWAQMPPARLSDSTAVTVLTCDRGLELYSLYGHTALRIVDYKQGFDWVFNYGTFDFSTPHFGLRFIKGDLQYFVSVASYPDFLYSYRMEERAVKEQFLNLNAQQKQLLWTHLLQTVTSDDRFYTYKFIDRNCTTMVQEVLEKTTGTTLNKVTGTVQTYREVIYPAFQYHFWEKLGTQLLFGTKVDQAADQIFLPEELYLSLEHAQFNNLPAVESTTEPIQLPTATPDRLPFWNTYWFYLLLLAAIALVPWDSVRRIYTAILGVLGLFFLIAGFYSLHGELQYNWQVLLCNPLWLVAWFTNSKPKTQIQLMSAIQFCTIAYAILVITKVHAALVAPMIVLNTYIAWRIYRQNRLLPSVK